MHLVGCLYYCINDARSHKHQSSLISCIMGQEIAPKDWYILTDLHGLTSLRTVLYRWFGLVRFMKICFRFVWFHLVHCNTDLFGSVRFSEIKISFCAQELVANTKTIPIPIRNRVNRTHCIGHCCILVNIPYFQTICSQIQPSHEEQQQLGISVYFASHHEDLVPKALKHNYVSLTTSTIILLAIKKRG